jgi:hypothetical protein
MGIDPDFRGERGRDGRRGQAPEKMRQMFQFQITGSGLCGWDGELRPADTAQATIIAATKST